VVTATLHAVMTLHEDPPPIDDTESVRNQHDALSRLGIYLREFDSELADVFLVGVLAQAIVDVALRELRSRRGNEDRLTLAFEPVEVAP
jgi:hypothetical protein